MNGEDFNAVMDLMFSKIMTVLGTKANEYADDVDRLKNFKTSAAMRNCTPEQALSGMMIKHTTSVYNMIESGEDYSLDQWDEKIVDHINYLILLKGLLVERAQQRVSASVAND